MDVTKLQPGPELDALVAEKVMGWCVEKVYLNFVRWRKGTSGTRTTGDAVGVDWQPSRDIKAAWEVWTHCCEIRSRRLQFLRCLYGLLSQDGQHDAWKLEAWGRLSPVMICRAALLAVEKE